MKSKTKLILTPHLLFHKIIEIKSYIFDFYYANFSNDDNGVSLKYLFVSNIIHYTLLS